MTAPAPTEATCPHCRQPQPLTPGGRIARHYDDALPASTRHCPGGRKTPAGNDKENVQ